MTRKTTQVQPQLHSLLRLGHQVDRVKDELKSANADKALELAKDKLLDSPNTCKTFKKSIAKRVDFAPNEKIYNKLASLDITESLDDDTLKRVVKNAPVGKRDPEPCLSDFHQPFQGEPLPMTLDSKEARNEISKNLANLNPDWRAMYLTNRVRIQDTWK